MRAGTMHCRRGGRRPAGRGRRPRPSRLSAARERGAARGPMSATVRPRDDDAGRPNAL